MKTWSDLQTDFQNMTNDTSSANLTFGQAFMNKAHQILSKASNYSVELQLNRTSVASTYQYPLSPRYGKLISALWVDGTDEYPLKVVRSWQEWDNLRSASASSSSQPTHIWPMPSTREVWLWPIPSQASKTIRLNVTRSVPIFNANDYVTGTVAFTNGDETVTGSGTIFTAAMAARFIQGGDGYFYEIASFTSTTALELEAPYDGLTQSSVTTKLGQVPVIPEEYHDSIWQYAAGMKFAQRGDKVTSAFYLAQFEKSKAELEAENRSKDNDQVIEPTVDEEIRTQNEYPVGPL